MSETKRLRIDKSTWGPGPWQDEPDRLDFIHAGFSCMALRRERMGHWCAYVGVPREHPAYGKHYDNVDVEVHGGLTYSGPCKGLICHVPEAGMPDDVWWLGFDFAHFSDKSPGTDALLRSYGAEMPDLGELYWPLPCVRGEIESLAEQLQAMAATHADPS